MKGIVEYEPEIVTRAGTFKQSSLDGAVEESVKKPNKPARSYCPLMGRVCTDKCALFDDGKCGIKTGSELNVAGLCPVSGSNTRHCEEKCPLRDGKHCMLVQTRKENNNE